MYSFTVPMALMDYVPVLFFAVTMLLLQKDLYSRFSWGGFSLFAAGTGMVFLAGLLKATWKLLYALGLCDFQVLNAMFLPMQSLGFLLLALGLGSLFLRSRRALAVAPPVFSGSFLFIAVMVLGLGMLCATLGILGAKLKKRRVILLVALSFVCYLAMGYLSSRDAASAAINWIEQGINTVGQGLLLWGTWILHRAGLKDKTFA